MQYWRHRAKKDTFVTCIRNSVNATTEKVCQGVCHMPHLLYQEPAVRTGDARSTSDIVIRGYLACTKPQQKYVLFSTKYFLSTLSVDNGVGLTTDCNCRTDLGIAIKDPHGLAKATGLATFAWACGDNEGLVR